ncbi:MAG: hypothetical protein WC050_00795 [Candidatus Paceibacterota bacterium]
MADSTVLRWTAYEHEHVQRGSDWFWALGIVAVSVAITSILFHDFLFALVIIAAAVSLALLANTPPDIARFEVSDRGIRVNDILHRYDEIISFWVEEEHAPHRPLLLIDTTKLFAPNIIIPIEHIDPSLVRAFLKERTTETPMKEPVAHKILEFFGL